MPAHTRNSRPLPIATENRCRSSEDTKTLVHQGIEEVFNQKKMAVIGAFVAPTPVDDEAPSGVPGGLEEIQQGIGLLNDASHYAVGLGCGRCRRATSTRAGPALRSTGRACAWSSER